MHPDDPDEGHGEHDTGNVGRDARVGMNEVIAKDGGDDADDRNQRNPRRVRHPGCDADQGLATEHQVGCEESYIHHEHDAHHEQRAERAELAAGLDHLRNTERRSLRRNAAP